MYVRQCVQTQGLDCFKNMKINGEEIIENNNDNDKDNDNDDDKDNDDKGKGKDESEQSIIMALRKLELGNALRNSTPSLPLPLLPDSPPMSVSIMLLGDLNSTPETAVIEYFKTYVHTLAHNRA